MSRLLVIGCGGVASVAIHKCCQLSEVFTELCIASRTKSKCDALKKELETKTSTKITTAQLDADHVDEIIALINSYKPDAVLNVALPYQDLTIMDACLATKVSYIDTANYECENTDDPEWRKVYEDAARGLVLQHILTIPGSGRTESVSRRQESQVFWEAALIRELRACSQLMPSSIILTKFTQ